MIPFYIKQDYNICNLADYNTLYSCNQSIDIIIAKLENTCQFLLGLAKMGVVANPAKFQIMFLGTKVDTGFYLEVNEKIVSKKSK